MTERGPTVSPNLLIVVDQGKTRDAANAQRRAGRTPRTNMSLVPRTGFEEIILNSIRGQDFSSLGDSTSARPDRLALGTAPVHASTAPVHAQNKRCKLLYVRSLIFPRQVEGGKACAKFHITDLSRGATPLVSPRRSPATPKNRQRLRSQSGRGACQLSYTGRVAQPLDASLLTSCCFLFY